MPLCGCPDLRTRGRHFLAGFPDWLARGKSRSLFTPSRNWHRARRAVPLRPPGRTYGLHARPDGRDSVVRSAGWEMFRARARALDFGARKVDVRRGASGERLQEFGLFLFLFFFFLLALFFFLAFVFVDLFFRHLVILA
jgi:hypothetical protein